MRLRNELKKLLLEVEGARAPVPAGDANGHNTMKRAIEEPSL